MLDIPESVYRDIKRMSEFEELLARFRRQRDATRAALDRLNQVVKLLEQARETLGEDELLETFKTLPQPPIAFQGEPGRVRGVVSPAEIAALVRSILLEVGRPMKRGEVATELEKRNIPMAGRDRNKNLGTILWRHAGQFVHLDKLGYWPKDSTLPGIYEPDDSSSRNGDP